MIPLRTAVQLAAVVLLAIVAGIVVVAILRPPSPTAFAGLDRRELLVASEKLTVVVAKDRDRGLMGVRDLGDVDGMLFDYAVPVDPGVNRFWMQGVEIPLDIAFFDGAGVLIGQVAMTLCPAADQEARTCPLYAAPGPFRWALETEAGRFRFEPRANLTGAG